MKTKTIFYSLLTLLLWLPSFGTAEEGSVVRLKLNGQRKTISLDGGQDTVTFYGVSRGNQTSQIKTTVLGPRGLRYKVRAVQFKGGVQKALKAKKRKHFNIALMDFEDWSREHNTCREVTVATDEQEELDEFDVENYPPTWNAWCEAFPLEDLQGIADTFNEISAGGWTVLNACSYLTDGLSPECINPTCENCFLEQPLLDAIEAYLGYLPGSADDPNGELSCEQPQGQAVPLSLPTAVPRRVTYQSRYGTLRKDSCGRERDKYLVRVDVDLTRVSQRNRERVREVTVSVDVMDYAGSRESALKPESEGRYSPRPIVLMNWLGTSCGANIDVVQWRRGKPVSERRLNLYSYLIYKGYTLALALVDDALFGGQASVDQTDLDDGYGVCMNMVRARQNFNGYPR